jgi:hypothetical protein
MTSISMTKQHAMFGRSVVEKNYAIENVSLNLNFTFNLYVQILLGVVQKFGVPILNSKWINM